MTTRWNLNLDDWFSTLARSCANQLGRARSFALGFVVVVVWGVCGPIFDYSDTWQLIINTGTTIATYLMIFLLQNTQNRDTLEMNLKLDELIRANEHAHNRMMRLEELTERQLKGLKIDFDQIAEENEPCASETVLAPDVSGRGMRVPKNAKRKQKKNSPTSQS